MTALQVLQAESSTSAALVPGAVHSALLAPSVLPSAAPVPRARVIIPADVRIPVPAEAVAGGRVSFHYEQLIYTAALPRLAAGGSCLLRLTVAHWREASAAAARRRREEAARQRAQAQAQRKEARVQREVRAAVESLVSAVEGDEREVRGVVQGLVLSLEVRPPLLSIEQPHCSLTVSSYSCGHHC